MKETERRLQNKQWNSLSIEKGWKNKVFFRKQIFQALLTVGKGIAEICNSEICDFMFVFDESVTK